MGYWSYTIPEDEKVDVADVRTFVLGYIHEQVEIALRQEKPEGHRVTGWVDKQTLRDAAAENFGIPGQAAQTNFSPPNSRNRLDGQVDRLTTALAKEGLLVRWTDRNGLEGQPKTFQPLGFANNSSWGKPAPGYRQGVMLTTPKGLAKTLEIAKTVDQSKEHRKAVASSLQSTFRNEWGCDTVKVRPVVDWKDNVTYEIVIPAEDAERIMVEG